MKLKDLPQNQRAFTTTQITQKKTPVYYIMCDNEGDISATGTNQLSNENAQVISIQQLLEFAPDIENVEIISGQRLFRATATSNWQPF